MSDRTCWGIFRESTHSPGRESDDAEILRLTAKRLEAKGFEVTLKEPDEIVAGPSRPPRFVFLMCETPDVLRELQGWDGSSVRHVNTPAAVFNTYRTRMVAQFDEAGVPFIPSRVVSTVEGVGAPALPLWVKRPDVHNTQAGDVVFARDPGALRGALEALAERGIKEAVLQPHVAGDLVKFYAVGHGRDRDGGPPWFRWFYPKEEQAVGHPLDPRRLARLARQAAAALGVEVYGGDAIVTPAGELVLLDLNAWPSFALYRDEAAARIASHLALRFGGHR